ncbi:uncharacterized protein PgNI_04334 [Pyricularia grisea]|uniref:Uncharacterized protein n=1 Tax=Pyricularia grisea TaxID=148305 RepID=A0A6P8B9K0_PYRGI|nr:uncharacterized protein PgNI_04334 [Pyricularia grisea]TLD12523.1 hypothetical protein PgNI_04334 [Pyricularia grisea]
MGNPPLSQANLTWNWNLTGKTTTAKQGNRAQQKRERNAKDAKSAPKSQLKVNENAKNIQCEICKSTFLMTTREPQLLQHAENKHSKTIADCFPTYGK